ncbi:hypothetical protein SIL04_17000 [Bacillus cereus group sp. BfR-BA-00331]|uniref:hypothetical protein n=1 Tax=Bacillus cereus group TaxID=86661 RepID=UPI000772B677|nr:MULTISPECIES: hypothetical protein [Bacillus cereus group]ONG65871.1 hypothetical protein BKK44_23760 [Bacillus cereus]MDA2196240.1 hypothetical protein [Bacillus cereus group sp. Bc238]MDA2201946.1 hypothetical protein [Bacillus cereus group sp. Bc237]MDA2756987.1 hypothetical protein [Bacillus cereus group sp. Bc007]MDA2762657.1 hypothetical protein [Bacillus cereus group sp. Bc008]
MAYYIYEGKKHSISNFNNLDKRCTCESDYYTLIKNPIRIRLKEGKEPTVFKGNNEPYSNNKYQNRAVSFKGCLCELDKISESYNIYGARHPSQYNWGTLEVYKETGKTKLHGDLSPKIYLKWTNYKKRSF